MRKYEPRRDFALSAHIVRPPQIRPRSLIQARRRVVAAKAERRLSDRLGDLGRNTQQQARSALIGHQPTFANPTACDPLRSFVGAGGRSGERSSQSVGLATVDVSEFCAP